MTGGVRTKRSPRSAVCSVSMEEMGRVVRIARDSDPVSVDEDGGSIRAQ